VVVVGVIAAAVFRRRSQDDVHSVEHYHRQLHTLEEMRTHPGVTHEDDDGDASYPASAFRVSSSTVRLTEPGTTVVPPVPPPPVPNPDTPVRFDDGSVELDREASANGDSAPAQPSFMSGVDDPIMHSISHRPRRLGGPLAAVGVVVVLVIILIVTGLHSNTPTHHGGHGTDTTVTTAHAGTHTGTHSGTHSGGTTHGRGATHHPTTTTTAPPAVSAPANASANTATYQVADASYSIVLAAHSGECWVQATQTSTGKVLYAGTLLSGQSQTVPASGSVSVVAGAPGAFTATVNGAAVVLPPGAQAPFTLTFQPPGVTGNTGASGSSAGSAGNTGSASG
jgi:hypothetical protein